MTLAARREAIFAPRQRVGHDDSGSSTPRAAAHSLKLSSSACGIRPSRSCCCSGGSAESPGKAARAWAGAKGATGGSSGASEGRNGRGN